MPNWNTLLTVEEAAKHVGCSVNFLRIRARDGRLKCYRLGKLYKVAPEDLETLISTSNPTNDKSDSIL